MKWLYSVCRTKLQVKQEINAPDHEQLVWDSVQDVVVVPVRGSFPCASLATHAAGAVPKAALQD